MVLVDDCGVVINPLLAEGQVHGGVAQGIAQALFEAVVYEPDTGPADHRQPARLPRPVGARPARLRRPGASPRRARTTRSGPRASASRGGRGAAAVVNAIVDALAPFGVEHVDMPVTPRRCGDPGGGTLMASGTTRVGHHRQRSMATEHRRSTPARCSCTTCASTCA
jgi:aerobic carbon-monoxide dehydrogenase large subunit